MFEDLPSHARGVLIGTMCAVFFTPLVVAMLRRSFPVWNETAPLSAPALQRNKRIATESVWIGVAFPALMAFVFGGARVVDILGAGMLLGGLFGTSILWVLIRTRIHGRDGLPEFARYFEREYGYRFSRWLRLSAIAGAIGAICLVLLARDS